MEYKKVNIKIVLNQNEDDRANLYLLDVPKVEADRFEKWYLDNGTILIPPSFRFNYEDEIAYVKKVDIKAVHITKDKI